MFLLDQHQKRGARFGERDGVTIVRDYGNLRGEYDVLRDDAGLIDLAHFGALRVEGRDRVAWLHKLVTANVQALTEGSGAYSLLLNAKGHVVADFVLLVQAGALLLYTSQGAKEKLFVHLRRAIFREKVVLADVSDSLAILSLQGARARGVLSLIDDKRKAFEFSTLKLSAIDAIVVRHPRAGTDGFDLIVPRDHVSVMWNSLIESGARPVGIDALNIARLEAGIAWYGDDFDEAMLAPEARLEQFIAENKGCFTGQEVIARIKNRGHVNRLLTSFEVEGDVTPQRGDLILIDDQEMGWLTSAAKSFARGKPIALGYLRREMRQADVAVTVAHLDERLSARVRV